MRISLKSKIVVLYLIPLALMFALMMGVGSFGYEKITREISLKQHSELARITGKRMEDIVERYLLRLQSLTADKQIQSMDPQQIENLCTANRDELYIFDLGVVVYDDEAQAIYSSIEDQEVLNTFPDDNNFLYLKSEQKPFVSNIFHDTLSGLDLIAYSIPIRGDDNEFSGSLTGYSSLKYSLSNADFTEVLEVTDFTSFAYLIDGRGYTINHRQFSQIGNKLPDLIWENINTNQDSFFYLKDEGLICGFASVPLTGWKIVLQDRWDVIMEPVLEYNLLLTAVLSFIALIFVVFIYYGTGITLNPIKKLIRAEKDVANGKFHNKIIVNSNDEFFELAEQFNLMSEALAVSSKKQQISNKALSESEEHFREIVESTDNLISKVDKDGVFTYINYASIDILGLSPEECIGRSAFSFVDPRDRDQTILWFKECVETGQKNASFENRQLCKSGSVRDIIWTVNFHYDEQGQFEYTNSIGRDITEHKEAEEKINTLRKSLEDIIDSMPSILIGIDQENIVTQWNSGAEIRTGLSRKDSVGHHLDHLSTDLSIPGELVGNALKTGEKQYSPRQLRVKNGRRYFEDITVYPLISGGITGAVIRIDDVTEQVRIDEVMVQNEKMMSVGGLAAGMAHEINNPLAGMIQTAEVLAKRFNGELKANKQAAEKLGVDMNIIRLYVESRNIPKMLENIHTAGARAAEIVLNMLSFARHSPDSVSHHNIANLLDQSIDLCGTDYDLKKKYDFRQIEIERIYDDDIPDIPCVSGRIQQVFINILRNGAEAMQDEYRKAHSEAPHFILRIKFDKHSAENKPVRVEIEDNGPGMDPDTCKRIFEPFFTTKPPDTGTGLGLSVSYFIITDVHNGIMRVESSVGKGTKFIIDLPVE